MMTETNPLPFIEIEIDSYAGDAADHQNILQLIKDRNDLSNTHRTVWDNSGENLKLRLDYLSYEGFTSDYHNMDDLLALFIEKVNSGKLDLRNITDSCVDASFPPEKCKEIPPIYLVLKYTTNYKEPMRASYRNLKWYAETFKENVYIEEIDQGFLYFFQTEQDYINANLNKLNPQEFQQWLKNKQIICSLAMMQEFVAFLQK